MSEQVKKVCPIKYEDYTTVMSSIQEPSSLKLDPSPRRIGQQQQASHHQEVTSPNSSARSLIFGRHQLYGAVNIPPRAIDSQGSSNQGNLYSTNVNFDLQMKLLKNNVLIGTTNNNFQLPVVYSGANSTLVGFYNNRQKLESQQNKRQAVTKNRQISVTSKIQRGSSLGKAGIEQINLPLRGRPVTIGDRTRDIFMRAHYFKQCYEDNESAQESNNQEIKQLPYPINIQRNHTAEPKYGFYGYDSQPKQLIKSKVFEFQSHGTKFNQNANLALDRTATYNTLNKVVNPDLMILPSQQQINDKSMENILRFLDLGKQDYDQYKKGINTKGANVIDLNQSADIPQNYHTKKNKNDFYRFLLAQNKQYQDGDYKVNNDILIPRSILKKNGDQVRQKKGSQQNMNNPDMETLDMTAAMDETIYGQHLNKNNPLLSPKVNHLLQDQQFQQNPQEFNDEQQTIINGVGTSITPTPANGNTIEELLVVTPQRTIQIEKIPLTQPENYQAVNADLQQLEHEQQQQQQQIIDEEQHASSFAKIQKSIYNNPSSTLLIQQTFAKQDTSQQNQYYLEQPKILSTFNQPLQIPQQQQQSTKQLRKHIIRQTTAGGFFPTQVDVIEREILVDENNNNIDNNGLGLAFYKGMQMRGITKEELKKLQLNQDRIFGFNDYDDFQQKYFNKGLVAMDDMNKANRIKNARQKYSKINTTNLTFQM